MKSFNSLSELVPPHVTLVDMFRGGAPSPYVEKPAGIDFENGHLYICDTGLNVVHDWNLATGEARRIGQRGDAVLKKPVDVAVNGDGTIFVADTERQEIVAYGTNGGYRESFSPADNESFRPTSVLSLEKDNLPAIVVSDTARQDVGFFPIFDSSFFKRGSYNPYFEEMASENPRPYYPSGVAVFAQPHGDSEEAVLLISDTFNSRLLRYESNKEIVTPIGQPGDRYGDLGHPKHLDVGPDGVIFVADAAFRCVHLFNQEGQLLMLLGGPEDKPGGTPMPFGVTVAESLPDNLQGFVPPDFDAHYFLFVTNTIGSKRISLFAVGLPRG